jgi:probable rRNA maturation factor
MDLHLLRRILCSLLHDACPEAQLDLAIYLVAAPEMTRLNESFLHHRGSTDVITFDYNDKVGRASRLSSGSVTLTLPAGVDRRDACPAVLHGEIFSCVDEAVSQARRFRTTWQSELVRYAVHGLLHLLGYDDQTAAARRKMKGAEDARLSQLARQFDFCHLSRMALT